MVATFCLRLAAGLILMLPILCRGDIPPRFFRVHFLTALGLLSVIGIFIYDTADVLLWSLFGVSALCCVIGSIVWHLDDAPGGTLAVFLTPIALTACLIYNGMLQTHEPLRIADDLLSALVVGGATTAMLMGHSYLISPAMSISPLMRLLGAFGVSVILRIALACHGLWGWSELQSASRLETEMLLWLPVRWALGLIAPLILCWMAWETARIRSTQSATGILYVVVIVAFLGELTSLLLIEKTGFIL